MELKNLKIPEALHTKLKLTAIHRKTTLQALVIELLNQYYKNR